ncbi:MAG TPA: hypothetical protein VKW04_07110 [Planctomycetota bacterium]|nr:hypothetical protein [Planctomycetota bacterium]
MIAWMLLLLLGGPGSAADETQSKPASPTAPAQDPDRPAIPAAELKALRESNIFAPRSAKGRPPRQTPGSKSSAPEIPTKPKAPVVTGIFMDEKSQTHRVIVEDKNDPIRKFFKEPKFLKEGDEWGGYKVVSLSLDRAVFDKAGSLKEVNIGEALPNFDGLPVPASSPDDEFGDDGEMPAPADPSASSTAPSGKKASLRNRGESRPDTKSQSPESQNQTLENMKRRVKKNRPSDPEE